MSNENENENAQPVDDPIVEMPQSKLNRLMADARRQGQNSAAKTAPAATPMTPESIAAVVASTVAAMQQQQAPAQAPRVVAAAPAAPTSGGLPTSEGLTDIFQPGVADRLGPRGVRKALEEAWARAAELAHAPNRPTPPKR